MFINTWVKGCGLKRLTDPKILVLVLYRGIKRLHLPNLPLNISLPPELDASTLASGKNDWPSFLHSIKFVCIKTKISQAMTSVRISASVYISSKKSSHPRSHQPQVKLPRGKLWWSVPSACVFTLVAPACFLPSFRLRLNVWLRTWPLTEEPKPEEWGEEKRFVTRDRVCKRD